MYESENESESESESEETNLTSLSGLRTTLMSPNFLSTLNSSTLVVGVKVAAPGRCSVPTRGGGLEIKFIYTFVYIHLCILVLCTQDTMVDVVK